MLQPARWKTLLAWLAVVASLVVLSPNVLGTDRRSDLPGMSLPRLLSGLDLSGGAGLVLKLERSDIENDRLVAAVNATGAALRAAKIPYAGLSGTGRSLSVRITDGARTKEAGAALATISGTTLTVEPDGVVRLDLTNESLDIARDEAAAASLDVVNRRVSEVGGLAVNVHREGRDRIALQVPRFSDAQRLKDVLAQRGAFSAGL
ncbi:MAG TPA: protein translocase subunit SecDF, partial [Mycoplana sp.]|nr:protein translocase subunit SecDF [Mycoplana sp.]